MLGYVGSWFSLGYMRHCLKEKREGGQGEGGREGEREIYSLCQIDW